MKNFSFKVLFPQEKQAKDAAIAIIYHEQMKNLLGRSQLEKNDKSWQREVNMILEKIRQHEKT